MDEVKTCSKCGEAKPATPEFFSPRRERGPNALQPVCKPCAAARARADRLSMRERQPVAHGVRTCRTCAIEHPLGDAYFEPIPGGWRKVCRECRNTSTKAWAAQIRLNPGEERRQRWRLNDRRYLWRNRSTINARRRGRFDPVKNHMQARRYAARLKADPARHAKVRASKNAWLKQWREANSEKYLENNRRLLRAARMRDPARWRARNLAWRLKNPEKVRAYQAKKRAERASAPGSWTGMDVHRLFVSQRARCLYCGVKVGGTAVPWHVDHFIPLSRGGTNFPENLVLACATCNLSKHAKMPWEFMPEKFQEGGGRDGQAQRLDEGT